jgi:restriction system protein
LSGRLSQLVAEDPSALDAIEWRDLERMLANVFDGLGFDVELTPASKDSGKDIVLKYWHDRRRREYIVEVKHWRSGKRVGKKYLTDFVGVVARERRDGGLFLATYGYSENAIEVITELARDELFIGEKPQIVSLCRSYIRRNNGLWIPTAPLHEILQAEFRRLAV